MTVLPVTSDLRDAPLLRISIQPTAENGLETKSQVMIDKVVTVKREKRGRRIGHADARTLETVAASLASFLGLERFDPSETRLS